MELLITTIIVVMHHLTMPQGPACQQGSPPNPNDSSNSYSIVSWHRQPQGANLANLVNPPSNPVTPPANHANLSATSLANPANLPANPGNPIANIPANQANDLARALTMLASSIQVPHLAAPQCTKIHKPDLFDGSNPKKLQPFLVQLELNFCDQPNAFQLDMYKVNYMLSFLKGTALNYLLMYLMKQWIEDLGKFKNLVEWLQHLSITNTILQ